VPAWASSCGLAKEHGGLNDEAASISESPALTTGFAAAATADDIYARFFADADGGKPCYARYYDRTHMGAHPKQTVRRIEVDFDKDFGEGADPKNTAASFEAGIGFMLKRSGEWYGDALHCKTLGGRFDCYLDADGGTIRLTPQGDALRLDVTGGGGGTNQIAVEGRKDFAQFGAAGNDDRVFVLSRANRKLCSNAR
jgi:hypothetical protein